MVRRRRLLPVLLAAFALAGPLAASPTVSTAAGPPSGASTRTQVSPSARPAVRPPTYRNPLDVVFDGARAASCADPDVVRDPAGGWWYLYCTSDALTSVKDANGDLTTHLLPTYRSRDLIHWTYQGDAVSSRPAWVKSDAGMWAPDVVHRNGRWYLYYAVPDTNLPGGGSAIGVLTGPGPTGPWTDAGAPVVPPADQAGQPAGTKRSTIDPEVIVVDGRPLMYFGSYGGGLFVRRLAADGTTSVSASEKQVAISDRYEGSWIIKRNGWYYLLASATNCCNGPLTGYTVFAARSRSPFGPFRDQHGRSILASRVGGSVVLAQNGNRWVGPGHVTGLTDFSGQSWLIYHAVDRHDPYYAGVPGYTKRPALMDPLDWRAGWPVVRGGAGPSDRVMPGPAAQPGERTAYRPRFVRYPVPGRTLASDGFNGRVLSSAWTWVRPPAADTYRVGGGRLTWQTQADDIHPPNTPLASVLTRPAPRGRYVVQATVRTSVPGDGSAHDYVQGGLLLYGGDGDYVKLTVSSIGATRQTEFGRELSPHPDGYPDYGNAVVGPVGDGWTWLRVFVDGDRYTAATSIDGRHWDHGATWVADLGSDPRIGLVSMGGAGFTTSVDAVRISRVR